MKLVIESKFTNDEKRIRSDRVRFVAEDGRTMFEVTAGKNGHSIEIRGVECCTVNALLYSEKLIIQPRVSNCITVSTQLW